MRFCLVSRNSWDSSIEKRNHSPISPSPPATQNGMRHPVSRKNS